MKKLTDNLELIFNHPRLIGRIIKNYCKIALKKHVLGAVEFAVTYDCNLRCNYCSSESLYQIGKPYLTLDEIKPIITQLIAQGAFVINITGGEPLLRNDILEIISCIKKRGVLTTLLTNGYLLSKECATELKRLSLDSVQVSLNVEEQNFLAKRGSSDHLYDVLTGIENAKSSGLRVTISTILTNENINNGQIKEIIRFCKTRHLLLNLIVPHAAGRLKGQHQRLLNENSWKIFQGLCRMKGIRTDTHMNYFGKICPAGTQRIYIGAYGDVLPCDFIHIAFGNLKRDSLADILERMKNFKPIKNKKSPCLAGHDRTFIERYLTHIQDSNLPFSYRDFSSTDMGEN